MALAVEGSVSDRISRLADHLAQPGYPSLVVGRLLELRRCGERDFAQAWDHAVGEPPIWFSRRYPGTEESALELLRRECERAWTGDGRRARLAAHVPAFEVE